MDLSQGSSSSSAVKRPRSSSGASEASRNGKTALDQLEIGNDLLIGQNLLLRTLECPICLEVPLPPITQCKTGHFVCGTCRRKIKKCGICQAEFTEGRNFAIEALVDGLEIKCKHSKCEATMKLEILDGHLVICEYRPIVCALCDNTSVKWEEYTSHVNQNHRGGLSSAKLLLSKWSQLWRWRYVLDLRSTKESGPGTDPANPDNLIHVFESDGVEYIVYLKRESDLFYVWITVMLPEDGASKLSAELYIVKDKLSAHTGSYHVKWNMDVSTVHKTLDDVKYTKYCSVLPVKSLLPFSIPGEDQKLEASFQIRIVDT